MALAMIAEDSGRKTTIGVARSLLTYMARPGGQSQFSAILNSQSEDSLGQFDMLHAWIADNLGNDLRVGHLAEKVRMSTRNFARVYQKATGKTPAKAIELMRISAARNLLEDSPHSIAEIAVKTGFVDDERLRRAMQRVLGLSPKEYRERFGTHDS